MTYLSLNYMHEAWHQLWTLQEEMEMVEDDLWIPGKEEAQRWTETELSEAGSIRSEEAALTHLVTKHLRTSSCLQTNSMKRGDVILGEDKKKISSVTHFNKTFTLIKKSRMLCSKQAEKKVKVLQVCQQKVYCPGDWMCWSSHLGSAWQKGLSRIFMIPNH